MKDSRSTTGVLTESGSYNRCTEETARSDIPLDTFDLRCHFLLCRYASIATRMAGGLPTDQFSFLYQPESAQNLKSKGRLSSNMNPVYSPVQPGTPYGNPKNIAYAGYPGGYPQGPTYTPNLYQASSPGYPPVLLVKQGWPQASGAAEGPYDLAMDAGSESRQYQAAAFRYTAGLPYKVPPGQSTGAPPPYSPSPNPYQTTMYPIRSAYPQQNLYAQGAYYTQPMYAAQPHVIHHTTVVQPNSVPSTLYPAPVQQPRPNGHMTTLAMSAGTLLTTPQHATQHIGGHPTSLGTTSYRESNTNISSLTLVQEIPDAWRWGTLTQALFGTIYLGQVLEGNA
ncbi:hypothetical protein DPEC_G00223110 [Dallia pectoralis]|uniref:Uncharacterized protein n=1 Tax=Dallia pectoralis TaxID=75939 RepID=A0ACC2FZU2_DALPE|nr:hypothetical protein DPEC_G00223110 [Dallia pectoralis]